MTVVMVDDYSALREERMFRLNLARSELVYPPLRAYFEAKGYEVEIKPVAVRPTYEERHKYGDGGWDMNIRKDSPWRKVEAKYRTFNFATGPTFPYDTLIVDRIKSDAPLADLYASVSADLCHAAFVGRSTHAQWVEDRVPDHIRGYTVRVYKCPKALAQFVRLPGRDQWK